MNHNFTCLLIDDDTDDQAFFCFAFSDTFPNATCCLANHCIDAIERLHTGELPTPDYIFLDWNMPLIKAEECISELRKIDGISSAKLFVLSGSAPLISQEQQLDLGITQVLIKQDSVEDISRLLLSVISP